MSLLTSNSQSLEPQPQDGAVRWRWSRRDYDRMIEAGILTKDHRVELLDGEILTMTPIGPEHNGATIRLVHWCRKELPDDCIFSVQGPLALSDQSEPEPDLMILRHRPDFYRRSHATPTDVVVLVEVALSSRDRDFHQKLTAYAAAGVREYWIVDVERERLIVHTQPTAAEYSSVVMHGSGARVSPAELPQCVLDVGWLFAD